MFKPRYIKTWGDILKNRRQVENFECMNEEEKCAYHLFRTGEIPTFDVEAGNVFWKDELGQECGVCPHKFTCRLFAEEE